MNCAFSIPHIDDYPPSLDDTERDQIKAAEIRAARVIAPRKSSIRSTAEKDTLLLRDWVLPIFATFSNLAFNRVRAGSWPGRKADLESREFLDSLAAAAGMNSPDAWMAGGGYIIRAEIRNDIERSAEWERHQERLLELIDAPGNTATAHFEAPNGSEPASSWQQRRTSERIEEGVMPDLPELSESTKRKLAINVNDGKGAHPSTLRIYADVFTKALSRKVTVEEIES